MNNNNNNNNNNKNKTKNPSKQKTQPVSMHCEKYMYKLNSSGGQRPLWGQKVRIRNIYSEDRKGNTENMTCIIQRCLSQ